ncbi:DNA polymerase delta subunit 2, partial [Brachionus plicatilis]
MKFERDLKSIEYENKSSNYLIKEKQFEYQYAPLYAERLISMKKHLRPVCAKKWPSFEIKPLAEITKHEKCVIVGTVYKEMKNKPNILKELAEDEEFSSLPIQPVNREAKYIDPENDLVILEDDLQRILLKDAHTSQCQLIKNNILCTGLVVALLGSENENSEFEVEDFAFKETPIFQTKIIPRPVSHKEDKYMVFLSGIELGDGSTTNSFLFKLQLLVDYLRGDFIDECSNNLSHQLSNTLRLVIAGNSLSSSTQSKDMINKAKYLTKNYVAGSVGAIKQLDDFLLQLISKLEVDIMPGEFDPSNVMLPQQPLHHAMLTKSFTSEY